MRDILETIDAWCTAGTRFAVASVVHTWSSAPKQPGAAMAVSEHGEVAGSVSGGCVESAVYEMAREALATGEPAGETFAVGDDDAFAVGLPCGGSLEIAVHAVGVEHFAQWSALAEAVRRGRGATAVTVLSGPAPAGARLLVLDDGQVMGTVGGRERDAEATVLPHMIAGPRPDAEADCATTRRLADGTRVLVESFAAPPRMLIFGAIDFAGALARLSAFLGHRVTVCDARPVFATSARFPDAHEVVVDWPHRWLSGTEVDERTAICVLTHDPKFDVPLLEVALRTPAAYIGAMGSRRTHRDRMRRLREAGVPEAALARLRSPIGLDLGGRSAQETAVSIVAEIIALRSGGTGRALSTTTAPIHRADPRAVEPYELLAPT
ncbi:XdhC family protein [Streptomyces sp. GESEQ-35]|uniref:XdhC family protein n=1 Tax=Streptomyces sp. GESEQ-35 TaxID=2812657 RepID=UPI001B344B18|nr:XdhC/CoxI family protein [Streptomyces sp. GESEQ-35]